MIRPIKSHKGAWVLRQNSLQALAARSVLALQVALQTFKEKRLSFKYHFSRRKVKNICDTFLYFIIDEEKWREPAKQQSKGEKPKEMQACTRTFSNYYNLQSFYFEFFIRTNFSLICFGLSLYSNQEFHSLYYYMRNFGSLIGLEQWYFSLIWNTYRWKLQTFCGW